MDPRQRNYIALAATLVLVLLSWWQFWPPNESITQGLDIQGGLSVILTAEETTASPVNDSVMNRAELIVRNRVDRLGASEATIQRQGADSILVQMPGIRNAEEALQILGSTGQLEFVDVASITDADALAAVQLGTPEVELPDGSYVAFMTGDVITNASIGADQFNNISVDVTMNAEGRQIWSEFTTANVGRQIAIVLDGVVQSAPSIREPITGGQTSITGEFTPEEARRLRTVLETGALPVTLAFSESRVVGPTLGQDSLRRGVLAALLGLGLVGLYLVVFYRGLGVLSLSALVVFASLFLGILAVLSGFGWFALSLPGIAGVVLTIGLAADSSILMNERLKEEVREGKTVRSAARTSTRHAIGTSIDADLVTMVSAIVLYMVAIGPVRGFALTLMIGIVCDIVVMLLFKRPAIIALAETLMGKMPRVFGLKGGAVDA